MELAEKCAVGTDIRGDKSEPEEEEMKMGTGGLFTSIFFYLVGDSY